MLETFGTNEGMLFYLANVIPKTEDPEIYFKYIQACARLQNYKEVERVIRETQNYDPQKVKEFLMEAKLPDPRALIYLCDIHGFTEELTRYLFANKQKQFKPNRKGYLLPKESVESRQLASNLLGPTHQPPKAYLDSLEAFIDRCGIRELIAAARAEIGEEPIKTRIKAMHPDEISSNRNIWQRTFRGTRFLKLLEKRSRKSSLENDA